MPYRLTTFQVNTWLQKESTNSTQKKPLAWYTCNTKMKSQKMAQPLSLLSYVFGGGMLLVPEKDVPYKVSQRPVEIC